LQVAEMSTIPAKGWQNRNIPRFCLAGKPRQRQAKSRPPSTANRELIGRQAGSVAGFHYTADYKKLSVTWDAATLEKYLANLRTMVPGTSMVDAGLKHDAKRA
jgi:cytochrome c2